MAEFYVFIRLEQFQRYLQMHRSITKTRGELQRITYKINQLKSKYITEGQPHLKLDKSLPATPEKEQMYGRSPMTSHSNLHNEIYPKQLDINSNRELKLFRNQIYQYIDKCLMVNREKEGDLNGKTRKSKVSPTIEDRILKIEEQLTSCLSTNQEIMVEFKKAEKKNNEKIGLLHENILKDVAKQNLRIQVESKQILNSFEESLEQKIKKLQGKSQEEESSKFLQKSVKEIEKKMAIIYDELEIKVNQSLENQRKYEELERKIAEDNEKLSRNFLKLKEKFEEEHQNNADISLEMKKINEQIIQFQSSLQQSCLKEQEQMQNSQILESKAEMERNRVQEMISEMYQTLQDNLRKEMAEVLSKFSNKIQTVQAETMVQREEIEQKVNRMQQQIEELFTNMRKQQEQANKEQVREEIIEQISSLIKKQASSSKQEYERIISTRVESIINAGEELKISGTDKEKNFLTQIQRITSFYEQESEKGKKQICDQIIHLNSEMQKVQEVIKSLEDKVEEKELKKNSSNQFWINSEKEYNNTQEQQQPVKKSEGDKSSSPVSSAAHKEGVSDLTDVHSIVDEKLNQFQSDINDTLKLLYDDFDVKVKEVFSIIDYNGMKSELQSLKEQMNTLKKMKGQESRQEENLMQETHKKIASNCENHEQLKNQIFQHIGDSVEKLSMVLERTVEQMEIKMEKLDQNFNYIYEKLSTVEFDNAKFKDRLQSYINMEGKKEDPHQLEDFTPNKGAANKGAGESLLDALGAFSSGGKFFYEEQ